MICTDKLELPELAKREVTGSILIVSDNFSLDDKFGSSLNRMGNFYNSGHRA